MPDTLNEALRKEDLKKELTSLPEKIREAEKNHEIDILPDITIQRYHNDRFTIKCKDSSDKPFSLTFFDSDLRTVQCYENKLPINPYDKKNTSTLDTTILMFYFKDGSNIQLNVAQNYDNIYRELYTCDVV